MTFEDAVQAIQPGHYRHFKGNEYSFLSILSAIDFVKEKLGVEMERPEVVCHYASQNNQCIGMRCPFNKVNHGAI